MRQEQRILVVGWALLGMSLFATAAPAAVPGPVELEVVGDTQLGSPMVFQDWLSALTRAGIKNVRIRAATPTDRAKLDVRGTEQRPSYLVTAVIGPRDELILPGARFKRSEAAKLAEWLNDLSQNGPANRRELKASFGLTTRQLEDCQGDLARPIGFSTQGLSRREAVTKIGQKLSIPLRVEGDMAAAGGDDEIAEELQELSSGTALACILRPMGFCLVPRAVGQKLTYAVGKAKLDQEVWPVGWPLDKAPSDVAPALFEFRNVNVQNVTAARVLAAVGKQIKLPVLIDHNALARHGIDLEKTSVSHPAGRTNYSVALRKILFQARMKYEIRQDEAQKPFMWVTSVKPV